MRKRSQLDIYVLSSSSDSAAVRPGSIALSEARDGSERSENFSALALADEKGE
jgi:hypothetical protein